MSIPVILPKPDPEVTRERIINGLKLAGVDPEAFELHPEVRFHLTTEDSRLTYPVYLAVSKHNGMVFMFTALGPLGIEEE